MKISIKTQLFVITGIIALLGFVAPMPVQGQTSADMEIIREKIRADKKLFIAVNMKLTETEANAFWPIYDEYQKDLDQVHKKISRLLKSYAKDYRNKTLTDAGAKRLVDEFLKVEQATTKLNGKYVPKMSMVLSAKKVARYLQIENKIRAIIRFDLAATVPLVK